MWLSLWERRPIIQTCLTQINRNQYYCTFGVNGTIVLIASRAISLGCFLFQLLPVVIGSLSLHLTDLCGIECVLRQKGGICVWVLPLYGLLKVLLERRRLRVFFFHKYTLVYWRTIVNGTCCFIVNPLYIHHPPPRSRCSRSWCPRSSRWKSLTAEAPAINRINSSQEHSSGRTHQFHYLSWTEAILALCHSAAKVLQAWSPPKPLCRDNMQQLSNALCQSLSASNIHLAGKTTFKCFEKKKK